MRRILFATMLMACSAIHASALPAIFEWNANVDGTIGQSGDSTNFSALTGLGTLTFTVSGEGAHSVCLFVDHDIDESSNGVDNEYGVSNGVAAAGQSWEIDEPGYYYGDIYWNFEDQTLDNTNAVPYPLVDDVSMAMAWTFGLTSAQTATIEFILTEDILGVSAPFYLGHFDPDSNDGFYFFSNLSIEEDQPPVNPVPEPATFLLMGIGCFGLGCSRWRNKRKEL
jgi:hypothetical protein